MGSTHKLLSHDFCPVCGWAAFFCPQTKPLPQCPELCIFVRAWLSSPPWIPQEQGCLMLWSCSLSGQDISIALLDSQKPDYLTEVKAH